MSKEPELKARDKVILRMTRDGAVEKNLTAGTEQRVSKRLEDAELVKPAETAESSEALSPEEQKKVQMRRDVYKRQSISWWSSPMTHSTSMIWARSKRIKAPSLHCAVGKA